LAPGVCLLSRGAFPRGSGAAVRSVDRFQIRKSLVVGRSCRCWHLGPGVEWDVPLGPGHLRRCSGRRVSPPGNDTPGTSVIRQECWSRGRIVSALLAAAQGGCLPSMEPPNPVAATMGPPSGASKGCSTSDTGLHLGQWGFMKGASPEVLRAYRCCIDQAGGGFLKPSFSGREQEPHRPSANGQKA
jgi:hypothetical protein